MLSVKLQKLLFSQSLVFSPSLVTYSVKEVDYNQDNVQSSILSVARQDYVMIQTCGTGASCQGQWVGYRLPQTVSSQTSPRSDLKS